MDTDEILKDVNNASTKFKDTVIKVWNAIDEFVYGLLFIIAAVVAYNNNTINSLFNVIPGMFLIAALTVVGYSYIMKFVIKFNVWSQIEKGNIAAAVFSGLFAIAFAIAILAGAFIFLKGTVG